MENKETLEEAAEKLYPITGEYFDKEFYMVKRLAFINGAKWQQEQDKNKYSEEEVRDLFKKYQYDLAQWVLRMEDDIDGKPIPTEWFEQYKKK